MHAVADYDFCRNLRLACGTDLLCMDSKLHVVKASPVSLMFLSARAPCESSDRHMLTPCTATTTVPLIPEQS